MSFLNNFKYHYHEKQLGSLIESKNFEEAIKYLFEISDKKKIFYNLSVKHISKLINQISHDDNNNKIVWINSFLKEDINYLNIFLEEYLQSSYQLKQKINSYEEEISNVLTNEENIDFNSLINQSYLFQWLVLNRYPISSKFITNHYSFFSSENNYNFTKPYLTQAYIFVINHPYDVYEHIKKNNNNDQEVARNIFLNLDNKAQLNRVDNIFFNIPQKGWHIHTSSWTDANVLNSLKGKIITKKELHQSTFETLSSIILHLIQSGVKIDLNYDLIENFTKNNSLKESSPKERELSQKEMKFLNQYVIDISNDYEL